MWNDFEVNMIFSVQLDHTVHLLYVNTFAVVGIDSHPVTQINCLLVCSLLLYFSF